MEAIKLKIDGTTDRHVKNPKTVAQTLQRVLVKAVALAYAMLKFICNHSFEGVTNGFECMNKFKKVNLKHLRERASTLQNSGQSLNQFYQFMPLQSDKWSPFAAIISQGHLPEVSVGIDAEGGHKAYVNAPGNTYADFVNAWGLQRGDQVTFVTVQKLNGKYDAAVDRGRILIEPVLKPMMPLKVPETGVYLLEDSRRFCIRKSSRTISKDPAVATVDAQKVRFPLVVRRVRKGDWMVPYGMKGRKLLSDLMTDLKFSMFDKRKQLVVVDAQDVIIWLVGVRVSAAVAVTDYTGEVLKMNLTPIEA